MNSLQILLNDIDANRGLNDGYVEVRGFYHYYTDSELITISKHVFRFTPNDTITDVRFCEFNILIIPELSDEYTDHITSIDIQEVDRVIWDESTTFHNINHMNICIDKCFDIDFMYRHTSLQDLDLTHCNNKPMVLDNRISNLINLKTLEIWGDELVQYHLYRWIYI